MGTILNKQICYALYSTSSVITKAYSDLLKPLKLTYPQFVVMMALWEKDHISITELADVVGLSKSTMSPLIRRLESLNYITKRQELGNDRQKCIVLTQFAIDHVAAAEQAAQKALCATGLNNEEAEQLLFLTNKIKLNLS
jgi:DNA-binding MarR family transcriptional regulator